MKIAPYLFFFLATVSGFSTPVSAQSQTPSPSQVLRTLTLPDAEKLALPKSSPEYKRAQEFSNGRESQQVREVTLRITIQTPGGSLSGALSADQARVGAGTFNDPRIFNKYANGVTVDQLVTDFGKTHEEVKSASLRAQAQQEDIVTSQADVLLAVDRALLRRCCGLQAVLQVAQQTVQNRQLVSDQVTAMEQNQLKSSLDVTFANVDLSQAQLLLIQAQNDLQVSYADLSTALGYADQRTFQLTDAAPAATAPSDPTQPIDPASHDQPSRNRQPAPQRQRGRQLRKGGARPRFPHTLRRGRRRFNSLSRGREWTR